MVSDVRDMRIVSTTVPFNELDKREFALKRHAAENRALKLMLNGSQSLTPDTIAIRDTLPFNDLSLDGMTLGAGGADSRDQWVLPALTQGTNLAWINVAVPVNRVIVCYGAWMDDALPAVSVLRLEKGGGVMFEYQVERMYPSLETIVYFPQIATWRPQDQFIARIVPRITAAAGRRFGLLTVTAEPNANRVNGDLGGR